MQEFYTRLDNTIGLTELTKTIQNYKNNKTILPVYNREDPSNLNIPNKSFKKLQTAAIINNMSVRDREEIENKNRTQEFKIQTKFGAYNEYKTEIEKTELKLEDLEDEFDHTK